MKKENENENVANEPITTSPVVTDDSGTCFLTDSSRQLSYSSLNPQTFEEKKAFFNMINNPTCMLGDKINMTLEIVHIYAETCEYISKETGESILGVRIVLLDKDGVSYSTSSKGVFNALSKVFKIFGQPHQWTSPIPLRVKQLSVASDRKVLTLEIA